MKNFLFFLVTLFFCLPTLSSQGFLNRHKSKENKVKEISARSESISVNLEAQDGFTEIFEKDNLTTTMVYVRGNRSLVASDVYRGNITSFMTESPYYLSSTEIPYILWKHVYDWAVGMGYSFSGNSQKKGDGETQSTDMHPVAGVSYPDAVVWVNAFTEWYNVGKQESDKYKLVYYSDADYKNSIKSHNHVITDKLYIYSEQKGNKDIIKCTAKGYRLPSISEWQIAARFIKDFNGNIEIRGQIDPLSLISINNLNNSNIFNVWVNKTGTTGVKDGVNSSRDLGLYHIFGNVWELTSEGFIVGCSWQCTSASPGYLNIWLGDQEYRGRESRYNSTGFRIARTAR